MGEYRVMLGDYGYGYIQFYRWALALRKVNLREVQCVVCNEIQEAGGCVWVSRYGGNGFVCIPCVRGLIGKHGTLGFTENVMCNLQACFEMPGKWSAQDVIEALCKREKPTAEPTANL